MPCRYGLAINNYKTKQQLQQQEGGAVPEARPGRPRFGGCKSPIELYFNQFRSSGILFNIKAENKKSAVKLRYQWLTAFSSQRTQSTHRDNHQNIADKLPIHCRYFADKLYDLARQWLPPASHPSPRHEDSSGQRSERLGCHLGGSYGFWKTKSQQSAMANPPIPSNRWRRSNRSLPGAEGSP